MAKYDLVVNGFNLNGLNRQVDEFTGSALLPGRRDMPVGREGMHGLVGKLGLYEAPMFTIGMWFDHPTLEACQEDLRQVLGVLASRKLLRVVWHGPQGDREAMCEVVGEVVPNIQWGSGFARLRVILRNPGVFWRGLGAVSQTKAVFGAREATMISDMSTAPVWDSVVKIRGPLSNWRFDVSGYSWFSGPNLSANQELVVDNSKLTAKIGNTSVIGQMRYSGALPRFVDIWPGDTVLVSGTPGAGASWTVGGKPAYIG